MPGPENQDEPGYLVVNELVVNELSVVVQRIQGRQNFRFRNFFPSFRPDRCLFRCKVHFNCQHTRCCLEGLFGLRRSRMSRHAFDRDHRLIHIRGERVVGCEETRHCLWKEEKNHHDGRDRPKHGLVQRHDLRATAASGCAGAVGQVKGQPQDPESRDHEDRPILFYESRHPRTGDPA